MTQLGVLPRSQPPSQPGLTVTLSAERALQEAALGLREYTITVVFRWCGLTNSTFRFTVSGGSFTATVPGRSAIAIHTGTTGTGTGSGSGSSSTVTVSFAETATTTFGEVRNCFSELSSRISNLCRTLEHFPGW